MISQRNTTSLENGGGGGVLLVFNSSSQAKRNIEQRSHRHSHPSSPETIDRIPLSVSPRRRWRWVKKEGRVYGSRCYRHLHLSLFFFVGVFLSYSYSAARTGTRSVEEPRPAPRRIARPSSFSPAARCALGTLREWRVRCSRTDHFSLTGMAPRFPSPLRASG